MIVGQGLIANAFRARHDADRGVVVYASGVSNSRETRAEEFQRERRMLQEFVAGDPLLLYFSTCSLEDPELQDSPYVQHKKQMEALVAQARRHAVFRLPQVVGRTRNPNTLTNYLHAKVASGEHFQVWGNARRNLIDVDDVVRIVCHLLADGRAEGRTVNVASPFYSSIPELVRMFEAVLGRTANFSVVDAGGSYPIDTSIAVQAAAACGVRFDAAYVRLLLEKYYGSNAS